MFLNPPKPPFHPLPLPLEDKHFQLFLSPRDNISSSSSSTNSPSDSRFGRSITGLEPARKQVGDYDQVGKYKSEDMPSSSSSCKLEVEEKWMPHKMKLVPQTQQRQNHDTIGLDNVRVCSDCNTTTTPLWRSGPLGPKSLCNACGIRQRKARRAAMEAANNKTVTTTTTTATESVDHSSTKPTKRSCSKEKKWKTTHCKKPNETATAAINSRRKRVCFGKIALNNDNNSDFARVLPRDVEEAAILLMELSCGFIHT